MKTEILVTVVLAAIASILPDATLAGDDTGMCPLEYFQKHPKTFKEIFALNKKYGVPNLNKLPSCSANGSCEGNLKCCKTPCGLKCIKPLTENNVMDTVEEIYKSIGQAPLKEQYEKNNKSGMCPGPFLQTQPELKKRLVNEYIHNTSNPHHECKKEDCQRQKDMDHGPFCNMTNLRDCSEDGDCADNMRCCSTLCGNKCVKPVSTKENIRKFNTGNEEKSREKRELVSEHKEEPRRGHESGIEGRSHGKMGGANHGKSEGKGGERGKNKGKGGKRGKSKGKQGKHGRGVYKGGEHGIKQKNADEKRTSNGQ